MICAHCDHPAHAPGRCAEPDDLPLALYGFCRCRVEVRG